MYEMLLTWSALAQTRGNQEKAAGLLRINPATISRKIKRHAIDTAAHPFYFEQYQSLEGDPVVQGRSFATQLFFETADVEN
jgi:hypothetical protein